MRAGIRSALCVPLIVVLASCASLQPRPELPAEAAIPVGTETPLDRMFAEDEARHPGQSAFRLLVEGPEAFVLRERSTVHAGRSLDVQTYIWHNDVTGRFLAFRLLEAADRGVKVRLLVDDMDARAKNSSFAALAAHPNIAVRMFNPFASREGTLSFLGEGLSSFRRINHRMHNKTWIADNRIAIVGGRNLGDEYFGASEGINFVDLDFAMIGPIVRDASASFDRYWNSPAAFPMESLDAENVTAERLQALRPLLAASAEEGRRGRYAAALIEDEAVKQLAKGEWHMEWTGQYEFAADDPLKATLADKDPARSRVIAVLAPAMSATQTELTILSPYFVPGAVATKAFTDAAARGVKVGIMTNSLVANDVAAVHGGYSRHREELVEGGVSLWELKPLDDTKAKSSFFGSSGASLHTKALAIDSRQLFVGSYNLDPRSTWLNCEQGVLVENAALARQLQDLFAHHSSGERAWRVTRDGKDLKWDDGTEQFSSDPKAGMGRRFQAWFARTFRLDAQL